jgi:pimeloyl-ACP methyl ester carboxylesterase
VKIRGIDLNVADAGGDRNLRPFVWTHGVTSSIGQEDHTGLFDWTAISVTGRRVVRYDVRGHGRSGFTPNPADFRWEHLAGDLIGVLEALNINVAVLGGASLGVGVSLWAALLARERVSALVLVIPPTAWATRPAQVERYRVGARLIRDEGIAAYIGAAQAQPVPAIFRGPLGGFWDDLYDAWGPLEQQRMPTILDGAGESDLPHPDAVRSIDVPTLVLAWDTDPGHPASTAKRLETLLPNVAVEIAHTPEEVLVWRDRVAWFLADLP